MKASFSLLPGLVLLVVNLGGPAWADVMPVPPEPPKVADVIVAAGRDINSPSGLPVRLLFDIWMRDPAIMRGPDGVFYLTGTTDEPGGKGDDAWVYNDGIYLWKSTDLVHWESMGLIWSLQKDATWAQAWRKVGTDPHWRRAVWAPSLCYIKGTYWIPYSMNYYETGLLKSTTGKPEGPYMDVKTTPMTPDIDAALFADDNGSVYFMWAARSIARMKDDMSDLAEPPRQLQFAKPRWGEGSHLYKLNGKYLFTNAGVPHKRRPEPAQQLRRECRGWPIPCTGPIRRWCGQFRSRGHNTLFQDGDGAWWSTFFRHRFLRAVGVQAGRSSPSHWAPTIR